VGAQGQGPAARWYATAARFGELAHARLALIDRQQALINEQERLIAQQCRLLDRRRPGGPLTAA
jgi:hypothetical protein